MPPDTPSFQGFLLFVTGIPEQGQDIIKMLCWLVVGVPHPVCVRMHKNVLTLKVLWSMSEFGGSRKHGNTAHMWFILKWATPYYGCSLSRRGKQPEFPVHCIGTRKLSNQIKSNQINSNQIKSNESSLTSGSQKWYRQDEERSRELTSNRYTVNTEYDGPAAMWAILMFH